MSLNKESTNIAYNLGRIFAILEKIQMDSSNGATNIREKYLSSASSTPKSIFPNLLNLAQYHIAKINKENNTKFNYYDKVIGEILLNVNEFPAVFQVMSKECLYLDIIIKEKIYIRQKKIRRKTNYVIE